MSRYDDDVEPRRLDRTAVSRALLAATAACCVTWFAPKQARALEVDSYYAWGRTIRDSSEVVDAKFNLEIRTALAELAARPRRRTPSCADAADRVRARLELEIFHPIGLWAFQSPMLDRVPADPEEERSYRRDNLYGDVGFPDIGMWMPITPVIVLDGVVVGIDKLDHFVSSGWNLRNAYLRSRHAGHSVPEAERRAIRWGILEERTINGRLSTGVLSRSDLEANYQGMRFYVELCEGDDPMLALEHGAWVLRREFDIRRYVTPEWDEAYQPSVFSPGRWKHVRPRLLQYCDRLAEPAVQRLLAGYRARDTVTPVEVVFDQLVSEGRVSDPARFRLEANCPAVPGPAAEPDPALFEAGSDQRAREPKPDPGEVTLELEALDADRRLRLFGLVGAFLDYPKTVSGAIGVLFAHPRASDDCRSVCLMTGGYLQLEAGLHGAQLGLGYASLVGETGPGRRWITSALLGVGVEAALLRTWSGSPLDPESQTLAGLEGQLAVAHVGIRLGAFHRVGGADVGSPWLVTAALGWGY